MSNQHNYPLLGQAFIGAKILNANFTLTGTDSGKGFVNTGATGAITISLPKAAPGLTYQFLVQAAQTITISPIATDTIRRLAAGVVFVLPAVPGTLLYLECVTPGFWEVINIPLAASPLQPTQTGAFTGLVAFKPTDTTSATNILASDAALTLTFNEIGWYIIDMFFMIFEATSGAGGFQSNFLNGGTAGFASVNTQWQFDGFATADIPTTALKQGSSAIAAYAAVSTTRSGASWMRIKGIVQATTAGTAAVQWAQNSLLAIDPTTLMAGSYVMATKIG